MTASNHFSSLTALMIGLLLSFLWFGGASALTVDDVIALLDAGIGEEVILQQVAADGSTFSLDTGDILDIKDAGGSDDLILALIQTRGEQSDDPDGSLSDAPVIDRGYDVYQPASVSIYYDPFGYYWYPWPYYFAYCAPFSCFDFGFYYGAHIHWGWAHWGARYSYYAYDCGYHYPPRRSYRGGLWSRHGGRNRTHYVVSRKTPSGQTGVYARATRRSPGAERWSRTYQKPQRSTPSRQIYDRRTRTKRLRGSTGTPPRYSKPNSKPSRQQGSRPARTPSRSQVKAPKSDKSKPAIQAPRAPSPRSGDKKPPESKPRKSSKPTNSAGKS
ncbi:MAG: hypothetical protein KJ831_21530 [Candidatus Eisenbacteria bacterium]|nr:hypothetical protein [Candidatus Eisenbacteria bacterium]